jgi:hypothetical protein
LNRGVHDFFRGTMEPGVNDVHAGVAQSPGDDSCTAVVTVEAYLGDEYANWLSHAYLPTPLGALVRPMYHCIGGCQRCELPLHPAGAAGRLGKIVL